MDISNASMILKPTANFFCKISSPPHLRIINNHNPFRKPNAPSILLPKLPSWGSSPIPRRRPRRRNTLREKLQQVRETPPPLKSDSNSQPFNHAPNDAEIAGPTRFGNPSGNSALWGKLESWVDQYKEDSEFWGIGTAPIFTVYQDSNGSGTRVTVDEDEIIKRNRAKSWSLEHKEAAQQSADASSKIAHASSIAREIEAGRYALPKNSSVAMFVTEGKKLPVVEGLRSVSLPREQLFRVGPRIGFAVFCALLVFFGMRRLFIVGSDNVERTREEAEMLRRKKKSRMERGEVEKGTVEVVVPVEEELPKLSGSRPQMDRNELMKSIEQAKKSSERLLVADSSSHFRAEDPEFDKKVREIREMARKARELERQDHSQSKRKGESDGVTSILLPLKGQNDPSKNDTHVQPKSSQDRLNHDSILEMNSPADYDKNLDYYADVANKKLLIENSSVVKSFHDAEAEVAGYLEKIPTGADAADSCSVNASKGEENVGQKETEKKIWGEKLSNNMPSDSSSRANSKPKIIKSVKQAREYLAEKQRISRDKVLSKQEVQFKGPKSAIQTMKKETLMPKPSNLSKLEDVEVTKHSQGSYGNVGDAPLLKGPLTNIASEAKSCKCETKNFRSSLETMAVGVSGENDAKSQPDILVRPSEKPLANISHDTDENDTEKGRAIFSTDDLHSSDGETGTIDGNVAHDEQVIMKNRTERECRTLDASDDKQALDSLGTSYDISPRSDSSSWATPSVMADAACHSQEDNISSVKLNPDQELHNGRFQDGSSIYQVKSYDPNAIIYSKSDPKSDLELSSSNFSEELETSFSIDIESGHRSEPLAVKVEKSWVEDNFQKFDPIIKQIGVGFKENYMMAKEKVQESGLSAEISDLGLTGEDEELEWMKDDKLREIVFQVRENELAGRDPFHLMDADDQHVFFKGLEHKAEKVNEKLLGLHEWVHSRIENLDYGADGISLDDPLEKIIPRWKGPAIDKDPNFLRTFNYQKTMFGAHVVDSLAKDGSMENSLQKSDELNNSNGVSPYSPINGRTPNETSTNPKTLIECSDGSSRPAKKTGKEHWQHTKKWSQGFLDVYNAETDPEIKSIMKDMGKDLDRWITEKERKDVADLLTKIPKRKRRYIGKKMNRLKREVEMYGAPAVISKYKEYSAEKEEDYLWWLDLQFVLCIELYTFEDGAHKIGFYSLEMAADLEITPKQYHVIAFEDPGDSKNFCYIVQAHMDMLGTGRAFVVARPSKDAFRDAKASGFNVTVIRKGEVKLNVDQTLEEVEEEITEIGSKIYHDKIMRERSVDINTLMKGVVRADRSTKR